MKTFQMRGGYLFLKIVFLNENQKKEIIIWKKLTFLILSFLFTVPIFRR